MDPTSISTSKKPGQERSFYKGVRMRTWGKWVSEIRVPGSRERIWLGSYDAPEMAARAHDAAEYCFRGERGHFNFPSEGRPVIPKGSVISWSKEDIKEIAMKFASLPESCNASASHYPLLPSTMSQVLSDDSAIPSMVVSGDVDYAYDAIGDPFLSGSMTGLGPTISYPQSLDMNDFLMLDTECIEDDLLTLDTDWIDLI